VRDRLAGLIGRFLPQGAAILSILTFGSYVLGLVRDRRLATSFGAGSELDMYNAAFQLPELLLDVLVESGLAAAFIPIFLALRSGGDPALANRFARTILSGAIGIMGVTALVLFVFAEATTEFVAPGFSPAQQGVYVDLFRLMLATPILFAASLTLGNVLLADQRFAWYGMAPLLYNAGIILGTEALGPSMGIHGPAIGAVIGAALHLASRLIGLRPSSLRIGLELSVRMPAVREFVRLMLPKMVSHPIESTTFLFFNRVATGLAVGSVSSVSFARNFQSVPVSVIGIAFALAVFPALSTAHAQGDRRRFLRLLGANTVSITVFTSAAALVLIVGGELVIRVFLGGGAFDEADVVVTAMLLGLFAISIPFESLTHLLSRAIYATRHTILQVLASLSSLAITVIATLALVDGLGVAAIPVGFAIGQASKVVLLALALAVRLRGW
jgi:putative peptidoglycan lipid II flippase